jgi:hypothetical protein
MRFFSFFYSLAFTSVLGLNVEENLAIRNLSFLISSFINLFCFFTVPLAHSRPFTPAFSARHHLHVSLVLVPHAYPRFLCFGELRGRLGSSPLIP